MKKQKTLQYLYDGEAPVLVTKSISPSTSTNAYSNINKPKVSWIYDE